MRVLWEKPSHLFQWVVEFTQDIVLIKDFALVAMLIVVVDFLPHVSRKLVEGHVLLHLLVLQTKQTRISSNSCIYQKHQIFSWQPDTGFYSTLWINSGLYWGQSHTATVPCPGSAYVGRERQNEGGRWWRKVGTSTGWGLCQTQVAALIISPMQEAQP